MARFRVGAAIPRFLGVAIPDSFEIGGFPDTSSSAVLVGFAIPASRDHGLPKPLRLTAGKQLDPSSLQRPLTNDRLRTEG
jgi:hypothetical protein